MQNSGQKLINDFHQRTLAKLKDMGLDGLVTSFVIKYRIYHEQVTLPEKPIQLLRDLLESKGVRLTYSLMESFVREESERGRIDALREALASHNPASLDDYLKAAAIVLDDVGESPGNLSRLSAILNERGILHESDKLGELLKLCRSRLELERFEARLLSPDPMPRVDLMDGIEFERFLSDLFCRMGYSIELTKATGDQGADLVVTRSGLKTVVQAKQCAAPVGNQAVQEAVAAIRYYSADDSIVVTPSTFTSAAIALADANEVRLIDGAKLEALIDKYW